MPTVAVFDREMDVAEEGAAPEWVHLLPPPGRIVGRDGRRYVLDDPSGLVAAFAAHGADLPVDYEHQSEKETVHAGPVPVAGWIKALQVRKTGIWARVEWTDRARDLVASREYRYLSPAFYHEGGRIVGLGGAGLVHKPNLRLKALSSQEIDAGDAGFGRLAALLGLPPEADMEALLAAVANLKAAAPDPAEYAPTAALAEALQERNATLATMRRRDAEAKVEDALRAGHLTPAMRTWALALCERNPESFDRFVAASPAPYASLARQLVPSGPPPRRGHAEASGDADAICRQLGLKPGSLGE